MQSLRVALLAVVCITSLHFCQLADPCLHLWPGNCQIVNMGGSDQHHDSIEYDPCKVILEVGAACMSALMVKGFGKDCQDFKDSSGIMLHIEKKDKSAGGKGAQAGGGDQKGAVFSKDTHFYFSYDLKHRCLKTLIGDKLAAVLQANPTLTTVHYAYAPIMADMAKTEFMKSSNTWLKGKEACKAIGARLPVFQHDDDKIPGLDLLQFNVLQRAMEIFSAWPPEDLFDKPIYKRNMGMFWKSCMPIGLVKNTKGKGSVTAKDNWLWINGQPLKEPKTDYLVGRYWLKNQPSNDLPDKMGPMRFGYLTNDDSFGSLNSKAGRLPPAGYFNDVSDYTMSVKQHAAELTSNGHYLDLNCTTKACMPCKSLGPFFGLICQKRVDPKGKLLDTQSFTEDDSIIPTEDAIPGAVQPSKRTNANAITDPAGSQNAGDEGFMTGTMLHIFLLMVLIIVLAAAAIWFGTTTAQNRKREKRSKRGNEDVKDQDAPQDGHDMMSPGPATKSADSQSVSGAKQRKKPDSQIEIANTAQYSL